MVIEMISGYRSDGIPALIADRNGSFLQTFNAERILVAISTLCFAQAWLSTVTFFKR